MRIGEAIRELRKQLGLTQGEFARRIGVTTRALQFYEADARRPDAGALMALLCAAAQAGAPTSEFASALERSLRLEKRQVCLIVVSRADAAGDEAWCQQAADVAVCEYNSLLDEALKAARSLEEFMRFAAGDALLLVLERIKSFPFLKGAARDEAEQGLLLRYMDAPLYDPEDDNSDGKKAAPRRVGLHTARALAHAFLEWSARAWRAVADGALAERTAEPGTVSRQ